MVQPDMQPGRSYATLTSALSINSGACVALIGGGGKTTTMLALAREQARMGSRVIVTTTTKIWPPARVPVVLVSQEKSVLDSVDAHLARSATVALGHTRNDRGKLTGIQPDLVCALAACGSRVILVEADGAAGRPVKVHGAGEPVVPDCTTHTLVVAGIDAVGEPVGEDSVHRLHEYVRLMGPACGETVEAEDLARILAAATRFSPPGSRTLIVLNKVDSPERERAARSVTRALRPTSGISAVIWTAWGVPVEVQATSPDR